MVHKIAQKWKIMQFIMQIRKKNLGTLSDRTDAYFVDRVWTGTGLNQLRGKPRRWPGLGWDTFLGSFWLDKSKFLNPFLNNTRQGPTSRDQITKCFEPNLDEKCLSNEGTDFQGTMKSSRCNRSLVDERIRDQFQDT